jgi:hypothetical protein
MTWVFCSINTVVTVTGLDANHAGICITLPEGRRLWSTGFSAKRRSRSYP